MAGTAALWGTFTLDVINSLNFFFYYEHILLWNGDIF